MSIKLLIIILVILVIYFQCRDNLKLKYNLKRILLFPEVDYVPKKEYEEAEKVAYRNKDLLLARSSYKSEYANEEIEFFMLVPPGTEGPEVKRVLILLHGIRDSKECWLEKAKLMDIYSELLGEKEIEKMVIIVPDSGYNGESWYTNFYKLKGFQYEEYFSKELIPLIEQQFPNAKFGIAGFSMGGYGAFKIGLKNLEKFHVIGSMAGAISLIRLILKRRVLKIFRYLYIPEFLFNTFDTKHFIRVFGSMGRAILKEDPYTLLKRISYSKINGKKFYLSVGTEDNEPYWMFQQWIDCVGRMKGYGYDFKALLYRGECHTWDYVAKDLKSFLKYFSDNTK